MRDAAAASSSSSLDLGAPASSRSLSFSLFPRLSVCGEQMRETTNMKIRCRRKRKQSLFTKRIHLSMSSIPFLQQRQRLLLLPPPKTSPSSTSRSSGSPRIPSRSSLGRGTSRRPSSPLLLLAGRCSRPLPQRQRRRRSAAGSCRALSCSRSRSAP